MAVSVGNVALVLDISSHRAVVTDQRIRPAVVDVLLNLPKRDSSAYYAATLSNKPLELDGESRSHRVVTRGKANSKVNSVDFDAGSSDEEMDGNGNGGNGKGVDEVEEQYDWEKEMKKRARELQDMKELERKAEELQSQIEEEEETEEEKRMRVKKELEKVSLPRSPVARIALPLLACIEQF